MSKEGNFFAIPKRKSIFIGSIIQKRNKSESRVVTPPSSPRTIGHCDTTSFVGALDCTILKKPKTELSMFRKLLRHHNDINAHTKITEFMTSRQGTGAELFGAKLKKGGICPFSLIVIKLLPLN